LGAVVTGGGPLALCAAAAGVQRGVGRCCGFHPSF